MSAVLNNALRTAWRLMFFTPIREVLGMLPWRPRRLGWRQMIAEAELPKPVQEKIEQVAAKSKLWNRERADIAEELIAHFQDGLEAGASAEELAESFGDTKTAALLIRNAKRRCRPVWWQAWWWMSRSFLVFVPCYVLLAAWLSTARPVVSVDYQAIINKAAHAVPEEERAWPVYMEALRIVAAEQRAKREAASTPDNSNLYWRWVPEWAGETSWTDEQFTEAKKWTADHKVFLAKLREAAAMPIMGVAIGPGEQYLKDFEELEGYSSIVEPESSEDAYKNSLYWIDLQHVQESRSWARILGADAQVAMEANGSGRVVADLEAMYGIARHAGEGDFIVGGLVKVAINKMSFDLIKNILRTKPDLFSSEQLRQMAHRISAIEYDTLPYWEGEKMMFRDIVQRIYSDDGSGGGYLTAEGMQSLQGVAGDFTTKEKSSFIWLCRSLTPFAFFLASREEVIEKYDAIWTEELDQSRQPLWAWNTDKGFWMNQLESLSLWKRVGLQSLLLFQPPSDFLYEIAFERSRGRRDGVLIGIALELYRREHGDWPGSLAELAPRWLPEVPVDRINGGALGYVVKEGKPVVYSLGVDGDDDGGRMPLDYEREPVSAYTMGSPNAETNVDGDWVIWSLVAPVEKNDDEVDL